MLTCAKIVGRNIEDYIPACGAGMRKFYGEHTKMKIGKNTETINGAKGRPLAGIFAIIVIVVIVGWFLLQLL